MPSPIPEPGTASAVPWETLIALIGVLVGFGGVFVAAISLWYLRDQTKATQRALAMTAYATAVQGLIDLKQVFAAKPDIFRKHLGLGVAEAIPQTMKTSNGEPDIETFLAFAGGMWRFSHVYTLYKHGEELGMTASEREGLKREMELWLENVPGFRAIYDSHTKKYGAHNQEFLDYLAELYEGRGGGAKVTQKRTT